MKRADGKIGMAQVLLTAAMALLLATAGWAADKLSPQKFVEHASASGMAEVSMGRMALEKSQNEAVKQFATQMVQDHEAANQKLKALASRKNLSVSSKEEDVMNDAKAAMLKMRDKSFDKAYMENQVKAHEEAVQLFQRASTELSDPELKALAQETLPMLQRHLKMAKELHATVQGG